MSFFKKKIFSRKSGKKEGREQAAWKKIKIKKKERKK